MRSTGFVVALTIAVVVATGAMLAIERSNSASQQQRLVVSNYETIGLMRQSLNALQETEIAQRTYLLTGDAAQIDGYEKSRLKIDGLLRQLEAAARQDGNALHQVAEFRATAGVRLAQLNAAITAYQSMGRDSTQLPGRAEIGQQTLDTLRELSEKFIASQRELLAVRLATLRSEQDQAELAGMLVLGGAFVCLVVGMFIILRSSSQLEQTQRQLADRSALLQTTLETLRDPIFVIGPDGAVLAWNEAFVEFAQWDRARVPVLSQDYLLSERSPSTSAVLRAVGIDESAAGSRTARVSHEGKEYEVSRGDMPDGGSVVRCVDITDQLRDEAALRQGQKMEALGQLTGGMAHDFNNILQVIQANIDLMKADARDAAEVSRLQSAAAAAERGARLTQQLLAFARRQPLAPVPINVARLVADLGGLLRHALGERIAIDFAISADAGNAKIDPSQLENAILNLSINARDAMPEGGTVRIDVRNATLDRRYAALHPEVQPGPYVLVDVSDTGTGMPPEVVARAFDPFFTTKHDGKGTGLGLSMVYGFVQQSNGHVRIDSAIGQGTSVKLYLPRTTEAVVESGQTPDVDAAHGHERVLVVEDNEDVRSAVVDMLSGWGYRVVSSASPDEAATLLDKDAAFDLLFTDVVMPGTMSAMELASRARNLRPGIAVLLTSGYARDLIPEASRSEYLLIAKPYRGEELALRLRQALALRPAPRFEPPAERPTVLQQAVAPPRRAATPTTFRQTAVATAPLRPRRVLVVEDEVVLRMSTTDMLERLDCFVRAVGTGEEALDLLGRGEQFDLLLTDLGLPGMSGSDLADRVRKQFPAMPIIVASGYGRSGAPKEGVQFIGKPYSSIDLQQALEQAARAAG
jgi:signal transduction histidine kinase/DNA-binding response OmpR family regulator